MKSGFLNINSEEYGYYYIVYSSDGNYTETGILTIALLFFLLSANMLLGSIGIFFYSFMYFYLAPLFWIVSVGSFGAGIIVGSVGLLLAAVTPPLILFGFPLETAEFNINAELYIFDSEGKIVCHYYKEGFFKQSAGLYYGHNPTRKAARAFSELFEEIFDMADIGSSMINKTLMEVGPITESNREQALAQINAFFARNERTNEQTNEQESDSSSVPREPYPNTIRKFK